MTKLTEFGPVLIGQLGYLYEDERKRLLLFYHLYDDTFPVNYWELSEDLVPMVEGILHSADTTEVMLRLDENDIIREIIRVV